MNLMHFGHMLAGNCKTVVQICPGWVRKGDEELPCCSPFRSEQSRIVIKGVEHFDALCSGHTGKGACKALVCPPGLC